MHDLRHSFVLRMLLSWYREDLDVEARLPLLSTFLGHVHPSTYWYLEAAPEPSGLCCATAGRHMGATPIGRAWRALVDGVLRRPADRPSVVLVHTPSPHTATASGCCWALFHERSGKAPSKLLLEDLDAAMISDVPHPHLERARRQ